MNRSCQVRPTNGLDDLCNRSIQGSIKRLPHPLMRWTLIVPRVPILLDVETRQPDRRVGACQAEFPGQRLQNLAGVFPANAKRGLR